MEKTTFDPWPWGKNTNSVQAVEVKNATGTLYCSGQVALDANGIPSKGDMRAQLLQAIANLEQLIHEAGYECRNMVKLNVFTTSTEEFFSTCMDVYVPFLQKHGIRQATTLLEVKGLFATLNIELEATVVKQMHQKEVAIFYAASRTDWRKWLAENHLSAQAVWLVFYNKSAAIKSITWSEAVEEALCFGWIDSKKVKVDEETAHQFFSRRKPKSTWSRINKAKVQQLIEAGLMTDAGYKSIAIAKQNGSWTILDNVEELIIPADLDAEFNTKPNAKDFFLSLSKSARKTILQWLVLAKRPETRQKRITEIVELAAQKQKPKHLQ